MISEAVSINVDDENGIELISAIYILFSLGLLKNILSLVESKANKLGSSVVNPAVGVT